MDKNIQKLLGIAGPAFVREFDDLVGSDNQELHSMLSAKNGFFVFESALRIFPSGESDLSYGLTEWNSQKLWRESYGKLASGLFFFAEDIFGTQFCLKNGIVYSFDPETADLSLVANNLAGWAKAVLDDYNLLTGFSIAHEWQAAHGALPPKNRLMPKLPFVCGGEFDLANLMSIDGARSMRCRGNLASQVHDLPDGTQIKFEIVD